MDAPGVIEEVKEKALTGHCRERVRQLLDPDSFEEWFEELAPGDPLKFADKKPYRERLSAEQKKKLKQATDKIREKYYREIAEMRKKSMEKILANLTREQRGKFEEMVGDFYDADKTRKGAAIRPAKNSRRSKDDCQTQIGIVDQIF